MGPRAEVTPELIAESEFAMVPCRGRWAGCGLLRKNLIRSGCVGHSRVDKRKGLQAGQ
jgi:hypothetical protein